MTWPSVPLRKVAPPSVSAMSFPAGTRVWQLSLDQIEGGTGEIVDKKYGDAADAGSSTSAFDPGNVLYSKLRPYLNKVAIPDEPGIATTELIPLRPNPALLDQRYLTYYLRSAGFVNQASHHVAGAKMPRVAMDWFWSHEIPLPPVSEQRRIVELLDEADRVRKLRREADARAARILPALFLKMFGDPATNPKGWPVVRIRDLAIKYSDGPFGSNLKSDHYVASGIRVIRLQNIGVGQFDDEDKAYISQEHFDSLVKHECLPGDVLIGTLGDPNLRACIQPAKITVALNKADCVQLRVNGNLATSEYVCCLLNMPSTLSLASGMVLGQTRARISMGRLGELVVPKPPFEQQELFAGRAQMAQAVLERTRIVGPKMDAVLESLLAGAFCGQLTAKWRLGHLKELLSEMQQQARFLDISAPSIKSLTAEA